LRTADKNASKHSDPGMSDVDDPEVPAPKVDPDDNANTG